MFAPMGAALEERLAPLRASLAISTVAGDALRQDAQQSTLVRRLRSTLLAGNA